MLIGIDFINSKGIVHADIKPENILIDYIDEEDESEDQKENTVNEDNKSKSKFEITNFDFFKINHLYFHLL